MTDTDTREFKEEEIKHLKWLYKEARKRLESRRAIEWKLFIGTWTALLVATGLILTLEKSLPWWAIVANEVGVVAVCVACLFFEGWLMEC